MHTCMTNVIYHILATFKTPCGWHSSAKTCWRDKRLYYCVYVQL